MEGVLGLVVEAAVGLVVETVAGPHERMMV